MFPVLITHIHLQDDPCKTYREALLAEKELTFRLGLPNVLIPYTLLFSF